MCHNYLYFGNHFIEFMSHSKLREEKNCLNCGQQVEERFCTHCGQENVKIEDSTIHLIIHYIQDLFHYDGKLWHTVKNFLRRPGQMQAEYIDGKRKSYLEPIRFYVFASTVFFLLFFFRVPEEVMKDTTLPKYNIPKRLFYLNQEKEFAGSSVDTTYANFLIQSVHTLEDSLDALETDTLRPTGTIDLFGELDSVAADDGWLMRLMRKRANERREVLKSSEDGDRYQSESNFWNELIHKLPQLFFVSLPFFAFFLKLLYFRSKRKNYVEHFIFSIYQYSFVFVLMILWLVIQWLVDQTKLEWVQTIYNYIQSGVVIYMFIYLFLSMKRFYADRYRYLIFRYFTLLTFMFFTLILLMVVFFMITFLF